MDWTKGMSAAYYANIVDSRTWRDIDRFEITGGNVSFTDEGLRNAADIECKNYDKDKEIWIRIRLDARQEGSRENVALFTGLASVPDRDIDGTLTSNKVKCYSVLQPCEDVLLPKGWYAPAGTSASIVVRDLLKVTPAPFETEGATPTLADSIVAEEGENHLTMIDKVVTAIGWRLIITSMGKVVLRKTSKEEKALFDAVENDCLETQITESYDWHAAPNVILASDEQRTVTYKDMSNGPLSVKNRGREIWMEETDCKLADGESLESYAERRLKEEQQVNHTLSYTRRFIPNIYPTDAVRLCCPEQKIDGLFYITSQNISLGYGAPVSEEVKVV